MAWNTILVERLRYVIYDLDSSSYTWTDAQLEKFLAIGAINVFNDLSRWNTTIGGPYTVDTSASGSAMISPDPITSGPLGLGNLITLNAACIIARSDLKKTGIQGGWKIVDDRSTIDGTKAVDNARDIADTYCGQYSTVLEDFKSGNVRAGYGILAPFNSPNSVRVSYLNNNITRGRNY